MDHLAKFLFGARQDVTLMSLYRHLDERLKTLEERLNFVIDKQTMETDLGSMLTLNAALVTAYANAKAASPTVDYTADDAAINAAAAAVTAALAVPATATPNGTVTVNP